MRMILMLSLGAALAAPLPALAQNPVAATGPWWVVFASVNRIDPDFKQKQSDVEQKARACGIAASSYSSERFTTFRPGYAVVVAGPFGAKDHATNTVSGALSCGLDFYLRQSTFGR